MPRLHPLTKWFRSHTKAQKAELIKEAGTSSAYLFHVVAGRRALSLELKMELEIAAVRIDKKPLLSLGGFGAVEKYSERFWSAAGKVPSSR